MTRHPDTYHTCYTLNGLALTQYHHYHVDSSTVPDGRFAQAFAWKYSPISSTDTEEADVNVFDEADRLNPMHPLYLVPHNVAEDARAWFGRQPWSTS